MPERGCRRRLVVRLTQCYQALIRTAPTTVPQTAADPMPINVIAARKAAESTNPSSSTWAREISEITIAGATLLKGTGVSSRTTVNGQQ